MPVIFINTRESQKNRETKDDEVKERSHTCAACQGGPGSPKHISCITTTT